jgi:hypothetical protein
MKIPIIILASVLMAVTSQAQPPTREEVLAANEWSRSQARSYTQRIVQGKPLGMRLEAFAQYCAEEDFPNDPAKQKWFVGYVVPLTLAIMEWAKATIEKYDYEMTSSNVFTFYATLKDHPADIEALAAACGLISPHEAGPEVRKAIAIQQ